jgi:parallel beta-helix repeat protein
MSKLVVGEEYKTIGAAIAAAQPGDVVEVLPGIYSESVDVNKAITLRGHDGAIVDGGWEGKSLTNTYGGTIGISAEGATVEGIAVRNCPGRGIGISAIDTTINGEIVPAGVTVRNCVIENCYKGGLGVNPKAGETCSNLLIEGNLIRNVGQERLVTGAGKVNGSFLFTDVRDSVIRRNTVVGGLGEGMNIDRNTRNCVFEENELINNAHAGIYVNCAQENVIRNNRVIYTGARKPVGKKDDAPAGILIGDEKGGRQGFDKSRGNKISGNVVVGHSPLFQIRNNPQNYSTTLDEDTAIYKNTFVAGPLTKRGIDMAENVQGEPHRGGHFFDNVVDMSGAPDAVIAARTAAAVDFHHNGWSVSPTNDVRGKGDVVGPLGLANPGAAMLQEWGAVYVDFDMNNYRPAPGSPLIGAGSDGGVIGALEPLPVEPPPDPEPPEPDYGWLIAALEGNLAKLEGAGLRVGAAVVDTHELIDLLKAQQAG